MNLDLRNLISVNFPVVGGGTALVFTASLAGTSILATDFVPLGLLGIGLTSVFYLIMR